LLEKVTLFDAETVAQALDELQRAILIKPSTETCRMAYRFIHGMAHDVIAKEQGPARLRLLHLRAAHALETNGKGLDRLEVLLARQYEQGGDPVTAIGYWLKAAQQARGMLAIGEALAACESAERLVQRLDGDLPADMLYRLYGLWGELAAGQRDTAQMAKVYSRMLSVGEDCQDTLLMGSALSGLAELASLQNEAGRAQDLFQRAAFYLQQIAEPTPLVQLYIRQGEHFLRIMRYSEAIEILEIACAAADESDQSHLQEARSNAEYQLGMAYNMTGWPLKAQKIALRSLRQDKSPAMMYGHLVMSNAKYYLDEHLASLEHARLGRQIALSLGNLGTGGNFLVCQTRAELAMGQVDAAWEHCQQAISEARSQKHFELLSSALCVQGDIYRLLGDTGRAIRTYRSAMEAGIGSWDSLTTQHHLAIALLDLGQVEEGLVQAEEAYLRSRQLGLEAVAIQALTSLSMLLALANHPEHAAACQEEWNRQYGQRHFITSEIVEGWTLNPAGGLRSVSMACEDQAELTIQRARQRSNPWWELHGYRRLNRCSQLDDAARARVWDLLDGIKRQVRHPDLSGLVEAYWKENRAVLIGL
jgi:tetratricopeptide (TPR) repeat protein